LARFIFIWGLRGIFATGRPAYIGGGIAGKGKIGFGRRRPGDRARDLVAAKLGQSAVTSGETAATGPDPDQNHNHYRRTRPGRR